MSFNIKNIIADTSLFNDSDVIYARKIDGNFSSLSEVVILKLSEEEMDMSISETIRLKCPGFDYFLQGDILYDLIYDLEDAKPALELDKIIESVIHYVEFNE